MLSSYVSLKKECILFLPRDLDLNLSKISEMIDFWVPFDHFLSEQWFLVALAKFSLKLKPEDHSVSSLSKEGIHFFFPI